MRSRYGANSARVWKRQPLARFTSSTERPCHSWRSSSSSLRRTSTPSSCSKSRFISCTCSGSGAASSAASRTLFASSGLCMAQFYVNRREGFGLRDLDQQLAGELEQREERDHEHGHAALRVEELGELQHPVLLQLAQDVAHVLAHRELLARDAVVLREPRAVQQAAPGLGEVLRVHVRQLLG